MSFQQIDWTDDAITEFWRYWREHPEHYFTESLGDTIVRFAQEQRGDLGLVMDYGAGTGGLLAALSRAGTECQGLDFGEEAIHSLKHRFRGDPQVQAILDFDGLKETGPIFDTVFLIETIEHLPDRHLDSALAAIHAALKPGGWLVASTPNDEDIEAAQVYCPVSKVVFHPMQHLRSWDAASLSRCLKRYQFENARCLELDLSALSYHSRTGWVKNLLKKCLYRDYKPPHLIVFAQKPVE